MELRHLRYFKTLADLLHFGNAAKKLFISQPPLSRQIRELEEELGATLFTRSNKRVALTDAGAYLKTEVDNLFSRLEEVKNSVRQIHLNESGTLKIGYISSVYQTQLAEALKEMGAAFPYVKTSLYEIPTLSQIKALEEGELDVGILRAPVHSKALKVQTMFFDPFVIVLPGGKTATASSEELISLLRASPFIFFNKDFAPHYSDKLTEICERMGFKPEIMHEANNVHSILQLVEAGLGVSILPSSLRDQYAHLDVSFVGLPDIPVNTEVVLAFKATNQSAALKWFVGYYATAVAESFSV
ncbi:LysR family transcriptional regulator [Pedobacter faecalis]|uniref:LysR family transcriptional regulator n=1 Tax=Pedobacter faecalis TaxID=3041495 RepID=UPI00254BDBB8|nr:LysR substrate-binding domain-containing protein [Pedobacter sp. ELA7]